LAKSYVDLLTKLNNEEISLKEFEIQYIELLEQAKEMHKQEIINSFFEGAYGGDNISGEQYYEQTYGGGEQ
jgi:disulfide oxidoreductase YuzD